MRVLVTRPENEARQWVEALRRQGLDAHALPLIEIAPAGDPAPVEAAWRDLEHCRAVMFVSGNAVRHFFARRPQGVRWPARTRAWAPGRGTREAVLSAGVDAGQVDAPPAQSAQFDSETLWRQVAAQIGAGDRVLIVRGEGADGEASGRDWLADQLAAAGAQAQVIAAYRRQPPRWGEAELALARHGGIWLFSSSQAIGHLQELLPAADWSRSRAVATHARIAGAARAAGFGAVRESRPALEAVIEAIAACENGR